MSQLAICWAAESSTGGRSAARAEDAWQKKNKKKRLQGQIRIAREGRGGRKSWEERQRDSLPTPFLPPCNQRRAFTSLRVFSTLPYVLHPLYGVHISTIRLYIWRVYIYGIWLTALNRLCVSNKSQVYIYILQTYILLGAGDEILIWDSSCAAGQCMFYFFPRTAGAPLNSPLLWLHPLVALQRLQSLRRAWIELHLCVCIYIYFFVRLYLSHACVSINRLLALTARSLLHACVCNRLPAAANTQLMCRY